MITALPAGWRMVEPGYAVLDGDTSGACAELSKPERKSPHYIAWCDCRAGGVRVHSETLPVPHAVALVCITAARGCS